jgi:hypothetical protein
MRNKLKGLNKDEKSKRLWQAAFVIIFPEYKKFETQLDPCQSESFTRELG